MFNARAQISDRLELRNLVAAAVYSVPRMAMDRRDLFRVREGGDVQMRQGIRRVNVGLLWSLCR